MAYERNIAGENFVTKAPFGPVGRDLRRRVILVNLDGRRRAPLGEGRVGDEWADGYAPGGLRRSVQSRIDVRQGFLVGIIEADAVRPGTIDGSSYAASVHEGSRSDYPIGPRRKTILRWPGGGGVDVFSGGVVHPGRSRGIPFLKDALPAAAG